LIFSVKSDNAVECLGGSENRMRLREMESMRGFPPSLQLFDGPESGPSEQRALDAPSGLTKSDRSVAERLACLETWRIHPSRRPTSEHEPYSLAWYRQIEQRRYARHGRWIPKLLEFHRHRGEEVLTLGDSLGTDWARFAEGGAHVHYCTPSADQLAIVRRNFDLRRLSGEFLHASPTSLPVMDGTMDVVCLSGSLTSIDRIEAVVGEVFRVLKPGGKVIAVMPAKYNSRWWQDFWFPWYRWLPRRPIGGVAPLWSGHAVKQLFERFTERRIQKRHLRRSELPHIWRWMLLPLLERVMGRFLVVKAFKPLFSVMPAESAAA
jgi:SAM-dependent methyltransferase